MWGRAWLAIAVHVCGSGAFGQAEACEPWVAKVLSVQGPVEVERGAATPDGSVAAGRPQWRAVAGEETLCPGDHIRVGPLGRAAVQLADEVQTVLRLDERTTLSFPPPREPEAPLWLDLLRGVMHFITRVPRRLQIHTPFVNAAVEGTEFVLRVGEAETELIVFEGRVRFENASGGLVVVSREAALARAGEVPVRRVLVKPREAVEWALYYPPLIDLPRIERGPERHAAALREAASAYRRNDPAGALTALDRVPQGKRGGAYLLLRAGSLLSVGRVREAEVALAEGERVDPKSGGTSALRSVIALVRDQKDEALRLAQAGAMLDPTSPLPESALSYAYQGRFEIERALEHARRAVDLSPEDALLWARVSELELSRGDLHAALEAAKKAEALNPTLARTQTVLGFAHLTRIEVKRAREAFERAIQGDPADPLPRLGMGLAKIRDGDLKGGTREIETAASLDPNNSLIRSYLGKAYFEEKRGGLAETEFEQAKLLDPEDPTPWFYDAIQKQTTNRPVEALHDLERAIANNDNRAVYRSRLLLDQDLAARSAALGRIYSDLGFEQLGLVEGWKSVNTDPGDYSGHRLLADSYSSLPRHEIARVSELLQSQLLQPLNVTPIQPRLAVSNLFILEGAGPGRAAFNEFHPLFLRDRLAMQLSSAFGNHETFGEEAVVSGVEGPISYSFGQFHFDTEGSRDNNDFKADLYDAFVQFNLSPATSLQAELRYTDTDQGDRGLRFDPLDFSRHLRQTQRITSERLGIHHAFSTASEVIGSFIVRQFEATVDDSDGLQTIAANSEEDDYQIEVQHLFRGPWYRLVSGAGYIEDDRTDAISVDFSIPVLPDFRSEFDPGITYADFYSYAHLRGNPDLDITLGLSVDLFDQDTQSSRNQISPKFGVIWTPGHGTTIRAAAFRAMKKPLTVNQTVEPTQIAGFNQFFEDLNGTFGWRYGVALDQAIGEDLFGGMELSQRDLDVPFRGELASWKEQAARAYLFWAPHRYWAFGAEYIFERFERDFLFSNKIKEVDTHRVPLGVSFFHPSGVSVGIHPTYVHQDGEFTKVEFAPGPGDIFNGTDSFWVVDARIDYRLPKRWGIVSFAVKNLLDERFDFQQETNPTTDSQPLLAIDRLFIGTITVSF
ncbi:MAG: TonB-dependent receptor domain-containing protein [Gammaproteobacteria bacterium]